MPILPVWRKKTNIELNRVFSWLQTNKLTLNLSETKAILFNNHNRPVTPNINCKNVPLEQVNSVKDIGALIDSHLSWKEQIASVKKKVAQGCHALFKLQAISDVKILRKVYFSLIYPHLQYAILTLGKVPATHVTHLKVLHNRSILYICKILIKLRALPLSAITVSLDYLRRWLRSTVPCGKTPATVSGSEPLKICCHAIVTQRRPTVELL